IASRRLDVGNDQLEHRAADELLLRVAEEPLAEVVHEEDAPRGIPAQHDGVGPVDDLAVDALRAAKPRHFAAQAADLQLGLVAAARGHRPYSTPPPPIL